MEFPHEVPMTNSYPTAYLKHVKHQRRQSASKKKPPHPYRVRGFDAMRRALSEIRANTEEEGAAEALDLVDIAGVAIEPATILVREVVGVDEQQPVI